MVGDARGEVFRCVEEGVADRLWGLVCLGIVGGYGGRKRWGG